MAKVTSQAHTALALGNFITTGVTPSSVVELLSGAWKAGSCDSAEPGALFTGLNGRALLYLLESFYMIPEIRQAVTLCLCQAVQARLQTCAIASALEQDSFLAAEEYVLLSPLMSLLRDVAIRVARSEHATLACNIHTHIQLLLLAASLLDIASHYLEHAPFASFFAEAIFSEGTIIQLSDGLGTCRKPECS